MMTAILVLIIVVLIVVNVLAWLSLSESGRQLHGLRHALALYGTHLSECASHSYDGEWAECNCGLEQLGKL